jgi:hypothetical protein
VDREIMGKKDKMQLKNPWQIKDSMEAMEEMVEMEGKTLFLI